MGWAGCRAVCVPAHHARPAILPPSYRQVLLPTSVERDVPDWFFQRVGGCVGGWWPGGLSSPGCQGLRACASMAACCSASPAARTASPSPAPPTAAAPQTGQELKAAFLAATRRREQDQLLMTRATRERLAKGAPRPAAAWATVRVRFPEGISLQGEFGPGEPVAALFGWVADSLADPLHTYELVLPSRQTLEPAAQSGAGASGRGVWAGCALRLAPRLRCIAVGP